MIIILLLFIYGFGADKNNNFLKTFPEREHNIEIFIFFAPVF